ncbi:MAG: hypothetical protein GQ552_09255 [Flavobacteriaceae bacterium]|nr:hypothetical protein [Flavobacteriaceae bacterium]
MKVDLRDKLKKEKMMRALPKNHRNSFEQRLQGELHQKPKYNYSFLKIAASIIIVLGLGYTGQQFFKSDNPKEIVDINDKSDKKINSMADISPNLKKIENFYLTRINYQMAKIAITDENRGLLEVYLSQLGELQKEYEGLNLQLSNKKEISEETIDALIENLQLRLQLMRQLKKKLEMIENIKLEENENKQA